MSDKKKKRGKNKRLNGNKIVAIINDEIRRGTLSVTTTEDGVPMVVINEPMNATKLMYDQNIIMSNLVHILESIGENIESIADSIGAINEREEEYKKCDHCGCSHGVITEAEPIKAFPDDTIRNIVREEIQKIRTEIEEQEDPDEETEDGED